MKKMALLKNRLRVAFAKYGFWKEDIQESEESAGLNLQNCQSVDGADGNGSTPLFLSSTNNYMQNILGRSTRIPALVPPNPTSLEN
jgi:hypothetical protein